MSKGHTAHKLKLLNTTLSQVGRNTMVGLPTQTSMAKLTLGSFKFKHSDWMPQKKGVNTLMHSLKIVTIYFLKNALFSIVQFGSNKINFQLDK